MAITEVIYAKTNKKPALEVRAAASNRFVSIDPGKRGCAILFMHGHLLSCNESKPPFSVCYGEEIVRFAQQWDTVICERHYLGAGKAESTMIEFAITTGMQVGIMRPERILWVPPTVWQHALLGSKMQRASLKKASIERCKSDLKRANKWHMWPEIKWKQEAFADAWNLGQWFTGLE